MNKRRKEHMKTLKNVLKMLSICFLAFVHTKYNKRSLYFLAKVGQICDLHQENKKDIYK